MLGSFVGKTALVTGAECERGIRRSSGSKPTGHIGDLRCRVHQLPYVVPRCPHHPLHFRGVARQAAARAAAARASIFRALCGRSLRRETMSGKPSRSPSAGGKRGLHLNQYRGNVTPW